MISNVPCPVINVNTRHIILFSSRFLPSTNNSTFYTCINVYMHISQNFVSKWQVNLCKEDHIIPYVNMNCKFHKMLKFHPICYKFTLMPNIHQTGHTITEHNSQLLLYTLSRYICLIHKLQFLKLNTFLGMEKIFSFHFILAHYMAWVRV